MRIILLFLSLVPFLCWLLIAVIIILYGFRPSYLYLQIALLGFSLWWPKMHQKFHHVLYAVKHKELLSKIESENWIPAEFEKDGTEDKLHIIADDIGIIAKKDNIILIANSNDSLFEIDPTRCIVLAKATAYSSSIRLIYKEGRGRAYSMSITPYYRGDDLEIAAHPKKKVQWFAEWIDADIEMAPS